MYKPTSVPLFYSFVFEDVNVPLSGIKCQFQHCTVAIGSASLEVTSFYSSVPQRSYTASVQLPHFMVNVRTSNEAVKRMFSLVIRPVAPKQSEVAILWNCLNGPTLLQDDHCATALFERALRDTSQNSCYFKQIHPPVEN